ncbi:hypothetical protein AB0J72_26150 [Dactylosporangium sp. NPDC049742]|uniref:Imm32 family immunity protein n=1 Tax=Dactylosporangium sp. NPDC049742 TaxID=3154737 RepID=UPI00342723A1
MDDQQHCRLSVSGGELELAGPPAALRALSELLRCEVEPVEVPTEGGTVAQEITDGPLLVGLNDTTLRLTGGRTYLDIVWDALDGVAEEVETADHRGVNRHQHIEYYRGDQYRSPDSLPLIILADWPDEPARNTR